MQMPEIVPTPRECCKKAGVPAFCLGNCSPAGAMARQGNRINACSKYDTIIEGCFQAAEKKRLPEPELKPIQEQNAPASEEDPGQCIGVCGGICPPCKSESIPKEDPGQCIGVCGGICPPCKSEPILKKDPVDEVDGIGKEDETLVVKSKFNQNTLVVESDVISEKNSNKIGEVPDETLVVNSKLNPNTLVVESHVKGAKDSTIEGAKDSADIEEVTDERLVVNSKLNPNTLVVESHVKGAKDSAISREVTDERLVVKSNLKPNTLVV